MVKMRWAAVVVVVMMTMACGGGSPAAPDACDHPTRLTSLPMKLAHGGDKLVVRVCQSTSEPSHVRCIRCGWVTDTTTPETLATDEVCRRGVSAVGGTGDLWCYSPWTAWTPIVVEPE